MEILYIYFTSRINVNNSCMGGGGGMYLEDTSTAAIKSIVLPVKKHLRQFSSVSEYIECRCTISS